MDVDLLEQQRQRSDTSDLTDEQLENEGPWGIKEIDSDVPDWQRDKLRGKES